MISRTGTRQPPAVSRGERVRVIQPVRGVEILKARAPTGGHVCVHLEVHVNGHVRAQHCLVLADDEPKLLAPLVDVVVQSRHAPIVVGVAIMACGHILAASIIPVVVAAAPWAHVLLLQPLHGPSDVRVPPDGRNPPRGAHLVKRIAHLRAVVILEEPHGVPTHVLVVHVVEHPRIPRRPPVPEKRVGDAHCAEGMRPHDRRRVPDREFEVVPEVVEDHRTVALRVRGHFELPFGRLVGLILVCHAVPAAALEGDGPRQVHQATGFTLAVLAESPNGVLQGCGVCIASAPHVVRLDAELYRRLRGKCPEVCPRFARIPQGHGQGRGAVRIVLVGVHLLEGHDGQRQTIIVPAVQLLGAVIPAVIGVQVA
mmetsp:Transcript_35352/g.90865  ORF Transcript_35352/g.90865 Transcript_35352/m.90865 type:complete len:369 (+) Transcript_35352:460-1566(+)